MHTKLPFVIVLRFLRRSVMSWISRALVFVNRCDSRGNRLLTRIIASDSKNFTCDGHSSSQEKNNKTNNNFKKTTVSILALSTFGIFYYFYKNEIRKVYAFQMKKNDEPGKFVENLKTYTSEEVGKHDNEKNGIWVTYKKGVYDITNFVNKHPGGSGKIIMAAGSSIEPFWQIFGNHHSNDIYDLLESMRIGNIEENSDETNHVDSNDPYQHEPRRHKALIVNGPKPFCAEPPSSLLVETFITPSELFYVRNHLPVPKIEMKDYELEVAIESETKKILDYEMIKKYPKYTVTSAIMCGGNRRSEMAAEKSLRGLSWGVGAVGNATWSGARLSDVLKDFNINEDDWNHVQFEGLDLDPSGVPYGASIPISKALDPRADVILAYEMNGQPISLDHGFPIRAIVPGVVGARNVKWLAKIIISKEESPSQFQRGDYKGFSPGVDWDTVDFSKAPAIQEMPVISAICTPQAGEKVQVNDGKILVKGYAWSGGGKKIIRVDVTANNGDNWHIANIVAQDETAKEGRHWGWSLWTAELPVDTKKKNIEIWSKAVDSAYNVQPESFKNIWNLRGFLCNAYHRVKITLEK